MQPKTISNTFYKIVSAACRRNDKFDDLAIAGNCFWLGILYEGTARFEINGHVVNAAAPCFLCFDEQYSPRLIRKKGVKCDSIYFDPTFINRNMTYAQIHAEDYSDTASLHDFFLLRPFTDPQNFIFPIHYEVLEPIKRAFFGMEKEFIHQNDWYWSCRSRSYFIELLFILERSYGFFEERDPALAIGGLQNVRLQKAILCIESRYQSNLMLHEIAEAATTNHTTLSKLFKDEFGKTPMEYLWCHRISVAKKQLEFTALPIKDIASRCGFKTVQHFCRRFEEEIGQTPTDFRESQLQKRISNLQK